ncbi:MAG: hypothetical protein ACLR2G_00040 [Phascolarctobacterium faecium]
MAAGNQVRPWCFRCCGFFKQYYQCRDQGTGKNGLAYADVGNVEVHALSALTAVTAAVSAGATKTSKSDGSSVNIQGAGVYNSVNNTANAYIDGANIATTAAGSVRVRAMDTNKQDAAVCQGC